MEAFTKTICCCCLSVGRKMVPVNESAQHHCFLQIIREISISPERKNFQLWLCWECKALVKRLTKFTEQVKSSYHLLLECASQNTTLQPKTRLSVQRLVNISLHPDSHTNTFEPEYEVVKKEIDDIKDEPNTDNLSDDYSEEDNKTLIEISTKKRRRTSKKNIETETYREVVLNREEIEEERRSLELREDYVNAMFKCEKCVVSFPNADDLKDHQNIKHELYSTYYKCDICECSFGTEVSYNYHVNRHTRRYQCTACDERCSNKRGAIKHYEGTHCRGLDIEYEINEKAPENGHLDELPADSKQESASFPCELCHKTFRWKTSLRKHLESHRIESGQKRKPYCEPCRLSFTTTSNLQKHVKTSSKHQIQLKIWKLKESQSEEQTAPEKAKARIEQIKSSVNSLRQQFPCGQCDKRFQWRGNLLRHMRSHAARANGELVCTPCNRTFSSIATYKQHMKISRKHVSENDFEYMCSECGKRFANKTRLKDHVDWEHLKNFVHKCADCQKVFKSHTSLYLHKQVVHNKDHAEHLCDHCGKAFPNTTKLRSHIVAIHTRESPYACGACAARFSWHSCLSRHVRRVHRPAT